MVEIDSLFNIIQCSMESLHKFFCDLVFLVLQKDLSTSSHTFHLHRVRMRGVAVFVSTTPPLIIYPQPRPLLREERSVVCGRSVWWVCDFFFVEARMGTELQAKYQKLAQEYAKVNMNYAEALMPLKRRRYIPISPHHSCMCSHWWLLCDGVSGLCAWGCHCAVAGSVCDLGNDTKKIHNTAMLNWSRGTY